MKFITFFLALIFLSTAAFAQSKNEPIKVEAQPDKGFSYPYYLYVPAALRDDAAKNKTHNLLVIPNNTGKNDDSLEFHEANVKRRISQNASLADEIGVAILMPVFPRPATDWKIYTHALDRDSLVTNKTEYKRFDLQLAAMIDDAIGRSKKENLAFDQRVLMIGFSAAGMFTNRFTFLHPTRVKAAVIGSPGGWAIAPATEFKEKTLRYPIGTGDFKTVSGKKLDLKNLRKVPMFIYLGDKDDNDSVVFDDGYDAQDKDLIFELFGKTPVERWEISKKLYADAKLNAEFRLYPNVKHATTKEMIADIFAFFKKHTQ